MTSKLFKKFLREIDGTSTHLWPTETGLPIHIWVSENEHHKGPGYRPRLRILEKDLDIFASVSIDDPVEILEGAMPDGAWQWLTQYIELNQNMLLMVWGGSLGLGSYVFLHQMVGPKLRAQASRKKTFDKFRKQIIAEKSADYHFGVTGLPFTIWIVDRKHARGHRDRPRLKVTDLDTGLVASVSFDNPIKVLDGELPLDWFNSLVRFIKLNNKILLQLWNGEADLMNFIHQVETIVQKPVKIVGVGNRIESRPYKSPYSH